MHKSGIMFKGICNYCSMQVLERMLLHYSGRQCHKKQFCVSECKLKLVFYFLYPKRSLHTPVKFLQSLSVSVLTKNTPVRDVKVSAADSVVWIHYMYRILTARLLLSQFTNLSLQSQTALRRKISFPGC